MAKPHTPHGGGHGDGPNPSRPHGEGDGDGDGSTPSGRRRSTPDAPDNVSRAQETVATEARQGRPGGEEGQGKPKTGDDEGNGSDSTSNAESPEAFINHIIDDPKSVAGKSAEEIAQQFNDAGYPATVQQSTKKGTSGNAVQVRIQGHPEITNIQVHPGGGRHTPDGSPYWKISTSTAGKIWVIPDDFRGADDLNGNVVRYDE
ncbi:MULTISPECIES: hypothetical protein [Micromonospora]|uniref:Uncharacterized protein n=1 Tax=Micromonospora solifontis TaxID=2487138 RepID=A0ABX9W9U1_9ACTN|nr:MULTISPECIES: hypothetical protein [Micromonospora]NES16877.1 hypothetical protein [Micromonospora sp. PPF5-17B]NES39186.1 hypothetical protein [Micromonospora solifontis]NES58925.1 hypothetical protein [Micromonospora sp. PPF5-6]RNL90334.1 hypothetical protein EFE23_24105 [Micromonospora solifontis]